MYIINVYDNYILVSRASGIFPRMRMRVRKWAGEGKEKYVWADLPGFRGSSSRSSLASQPYFSAYAHGRAKVGAGREEKIRLGRPARFL